MGFELREIEKRIEEFVSESLNWYEPFPISREGLEYLKNELEKKISNLGARVSEFTVSTDFDFPTNYKMKPKGETKLTIKLDVKGQKIECWTHIPLKAGLVSAKLKDSSYDTLHILVPSGGNPVIRCHVIRE